MLGLPKNTETKKILPKNAIYSKFSMNTLAKEKFDADVKRIAIVNELSPHTMPIAEGKVKSIFVLHIVLKNKRFDEKNIVLLSKLISQHILFLLEYEKESKLVIYHNKLIQSAWQNSNTISIQLNGLNLDNIWQNLVLQAGGIELEAENNLDEQIAIDETRQKMQKQIEQLENKIKTTKQFNLQVKLKQELQKLKGANN